MTGRAPAAARRVAAALATLTALVAASVAAALIMLALAPHLG